MSPGEKPNLACDRYTVEFQLIGLVIVTRNPDNLKIVKKRLCCEIKRENYSTISFVYFNNYENTIYTVFELYINKQHGLMYIENKIIFTTNNLKISYHSNTVRYI